MTGAPAIPRFRAEAMADAASELIAAVKDYMQPSQDAADVGATVARTDRVLRAIAVAESRAQALTDTATSIGKAA